MHRNTMHPRALARAIQLGLPILCCSGSQDSGVMNNEHPTPNVQHPTPKEEKSPLGRWVFDVGCWVLAPVHHGGTETRSRKNTETRECRQPAARPAAIRSPVCWGRKRSRNPASSVSHYSARERRTHPASARDRPPLSSLRALLPWPAVVCRRRRLRASVSPWFNSLSFCCLANSGMVGPRQPFLIS